MKTVLEISVSKAGLAQVAIGDSPLKSELNQVASNTWELPEYDIFDEEACGNDEELKDELASLFSQWGIPEGEYWFNDDETGE